jgi:hypothetical protein
MNQKMMVEKHNLNPLISFNTRERLSQHISRLNGLLRTRMEAYDLYSMHCIHFLILSLTVVAMLYYSSHLVHEISDSWVGLAAGIVAMAIIGTGMLLSLSRFISEKMRLTT